jgi:hypothetical protein
VTPGTVASCQNHPKREAIGICVACRSRVCSECVTKVDGINYCVTCLARLAGAEAQDVAVRDAAAAGSPALGVAAALGFFVLLSLMAWGLVEAALPGGG